MSDARCRPATSDEVAGYQRIVLETRTTLERYSAMAREDLWLGGGTQLMKWDREAIYEAGLQRPWLQQEEDNRKFMELLGTLVGDTPKPVAQAAPVAQRGQSSPGTQFSLF